MKRFVFNPNYTLKSDDGRVIIMSKHLGRDYLMPENMSSSFETIIHPLYAQILSFFNGEQMEISIYKASKNLNIDKKLINDFILKLYNNRTFLSVKTSKGVSVFPPYCIVENKSDSIINRFDFKSFIYDKIDLSDRRYFTPAKLTIMVNNKCYTKCYYCYADKRNPIDCSIPFSRLKELIDESRKLDIKNIDIIGGEFFLYSNWYDLIQYLYNKDYHPYLSTKKPMNESDVRKLKEINIDDIQISLDTLVRDHLCSIIGVSNSYLENIVNTIKLLEKYNINFFIHTVLTCRNDSVDDIKSIYNCIKNCKCLLEWKIDTAAKSIYLKECYSEIAPRKEKIEQIITFIDSIKDEVHFSIRIPKPATNISFNPKPKTLEDFFNRAYCSANYSGLFILPDGQVTICEELYWNKHFIVGDILSQSINDIWNSKKALDLFYLNQNDIPKDSLCSTCSDFKKCRSVKQVCYKEIIKEYGEDKWYYPDILCPKCKEHHINNIYDKLKC